MTHYRQRSQLNLWLIPALYALAAIAAGLIFPRIELRLFPHLISQMSVSAAMAIYSAIASGMIALTGIVFSLSFVMVQFSATAYSPRLVLWMARDPVMSHSIGVFTATFLYAIAALSGTDRGGLGKVPFISSWIVVALLLASVVMFIALICRIDVLQINRMLIFTGDQGRKVIESLYPPLQSEVRATGRDFHHEAPTQTVVYGGRPRAIQGVDVARMVAVAMASDGLIDFAAAVGDTVVELTPLLRVYGARMPIDEKSLLAGIKFGSERTFEQDPKYALRLLVDIAIKALSPAVNDPTTAVQALDQIEDLLLRLGRSQLEPGGFHDPEGRLRLLVPFPTWDDFLRLAFDEIRFYGANSVQVMRRMNALVSDLISVLPDERHAILRHWEQRLQNTIHRTFEDAEEKAEAAVEDRQGLGIPRREQRAKRLDDEKSPTVRDAVA